MYMHAFAPTVFTFAFLAEPTNFSIDYRLSRVHRRVERTLNPRWVRSTTLLPDLPVDSTNGKTRMMSTARTPGRAKHFISFLFLSRTIWRHSVKCLGTRAYDRNSLKEQLYEVVSRRRIPPSSILWRYHDPDAKSGQLSASPTFDACIYRSMPVQLLECTYIYIVCSTIAYIVLISSPFLLSYQ